MRDFRIWVALLRAAVGGVWLFEAYPQVAAAGSFLSSGFAEAVRTMADGNPYSFYRQFLQNVVLTHTSVFAYLVLVGNVVLGVCLLLGLLTPYAAFVALLLNVNYALAAGWTDRPIYSLNALLIVAEIVVIVLRAGHVAGLDAVLGGGPAKRTRRY